VRRGECHGKRAYPNGCHAEHSAAAADCWITGQSVDDPDYCGMDERFHVGRRNIH
jgi:hypothetical protein